METWDAIRARRNVRQYTDQPIAREDLGGLWGDPHETAALRPLTRPNRRPFGEVVHWDRW